MCLPRRCGDAVDGPARRLQRPAVSLEVVPHSGSGEKRWDASVETRPYLESQSQPETSGLFQYALLEKAMLRAYSDCSLGFSRL